nr:MAG TPA: hypothetical protein [Caudoviricetes sp.]
MNKNGLSIYFVTKIFCNYYYYSVLLIVFINYFLCSR